jgi:hypothetical protein
MVIETIISCINLQIGRYLDIGDVSEYGSAGKGSWVGELTPDNLNWARDLLPRRITYRSPGPSSGIWNK